MDFFGECVDLLQGIRFIGKQLLIKVGDHTGAGAAGGDDIIVGFKIGDELAGNGAGFLAKPGVERGLAAASLGGGEDDLAAVGAEEFDGSDTDLGEKLVHETSDKEGDFHERGM